MHTEQHIRRYFDEVKRLYFPRWDRSSQWKVVFEEPPKAAGATGYCCSKTKTIYLDPFTSGVRSMSLPGAKAFLIHEICHDCAAAGHNRTWADRMEAAAKDADAQGDPILGRMIRSSALGSVPCGCYVELTEYNVSEYVHRLLDAGDVCSISAAVRATAMHFGVTTREMRREFYSMVADCVDCWERDQH